MAVNIGLRLKDSGAQWLDQQRQPHETRQDVIKAILLRAARDKPWTDEALRIYRQQEFPRA